MELALIALLLVSQVAVTDAGDLKTDVQRLTRQLGAAELSKRTEAEEKLMALGPKILEVLPTLAESGPASDAQKRDTIARIRKRLERQLAEHAAEASVVTLKVTDKPVSEVLAEITKQTGNQFSDLRKRMGQEVTDPKITVNFDKTPFWPALDKTLDEAELGVYAFAASDALGIVARGDKHGKRVGHAAYAGPLRLEATRLSATRDLAGGGDNSTLRLALEIVWEPRIRPISLSQPLADLKATDNRGQVIGIPGAEGELERAIDAAGAATEFQIPLANPPRASQSIASLSGKLRALLPGKLETFEFSDLDKAKKVEQHKAGVTVTLDEVRNNNDAWEARIRVHFDKADKALESFRGWVFNNEAYILDSAGKRIEHSGLETTRQTEDELGVAYLFDLPQGPTGMKFVYKTPALLDSIPLEYELKNLPLP